MRDEASESGMERTKDSYTSQTEAKDRDRHDADGMGLYRSTRHQIAFQLATLRETMRIARTELDEAIQLRSF